MGLTGCDPARCRGQSSYQSHDLGRYSLPLSVKGPIWKMGMIFFLLCLLLKIRNRCENVL